MKVGVYVFGASAIAIGLVGVVWGDFAAVWQPVPTDLPGRTGLAYETAVCLIASGAGLAWRRSARASALVLAAFYFIFAMLWMPRVVTHLAVLGVWNGVFEQLALVAAAVTAYAVMPNRAGHESVRLQRIARIVFGVCLLSFGATHFSAVQATADLVPKWLPPSPRFWAKATGAFHIAAGLAILFDVYAVLAAALFTVMLIGFGVLVWAPLLAASPHVHQIWAGNAVNFTLIGAAWLMADTIARARSRTKEFSMNGEAMVRGARMAATCVLLSALGGPFSVARAQKAPVLQPMPRTLEMELALSAAPPHLRDSAEVYVLDPAHGYVQARAGTNGFRCLVARTEWEWPQLPFRDDIFVPVCSDAAGVAAWLPVMVDVEAMRAHGDSPRAVYDEVKRRFSDGQYHAPARAGLSYMLSPVMRTYLDQTSREPTTMVGPHYMFYAPNVTDADIGGRPGSGGPFMLATGAHGLIFVGVGAAKSQEIAAQSHDLLAALCAYRSVLCVPQRH